MPCKSNFNPTLRHALDILLLGALAAYVWLGVPLASFHGDEGMQLYATRDYFTAFVERNPQDLITNPPYTIDSRPYLRLINGSVQRYAAGLMLHLCGYTPADFHLEPGWNWGLTYEENVAASWLPATPILHIGRYTSAAFFVVSIIAFFYLAQHLGGRRLSYPTALLYALNAALLLNGRRAMMEGSMLAFGMITLLIAAHLITRPRAWYLWPLLTLVAALTLASKHSGAIFLTIAWAWIFVARWPQSPRAAHIAAHIARLATSGLLAIALFVALSPALWHQPPDRLRDLVQTRAELLAIQVSIDPLSPTSLTQRATALITQPFIAPTMHYEMASWQDAQPIQAQIVAYDTSWLAGIPPHTTIGGTLMLLAALGTWAALRNVPVRTHGTLVGAWLAFTALALMSNPLPWQRYYLPLIPLYTLLVGYGIAYLLNTICRETRTQTA